MALLLQALLSGRDGKRNSAMWTEKKKRLGKCSDVCVRTTGLPDAPQTNGTVRRRTWDES